MKLANYCCLFVTRWDNSQEGNRSRPFPQEWGSERTGKWLPESENIFLSELTIVKLNRVQSVGTRFFNGTGGFL